MTRGTAQHRLGASPLLLSFQCIPTSRPQEPDSISGVYNARSLSCCRMQRLERLKATRTAQALIPAKYNGLRRSFFISYPYLKLGCLPLH